MKLLALISACFLLGMVINDVSAIINGQDAREGQFPHMLYLQIHSGPECSNRCGGALLSSKHILTAAHCVAHHQPSDIKLAAGVTNFDDNPSMQQRTVAKIKVHPKYGNKQDGSFKKFFKSLFQSFFQAKDVTEDNDIAMLKLKDEVTLGGVVGVINIPPRDYQLPYHEEARLSGWGALSELTGKQVELPRILQWLDMKILRPEESDDDSGKPIDDSEFIAEKKFADGTWANAAGGDSGSPLVKYGVVIGVAAAIHKVKHYTRFMKVHYYLDFIKKSARL